MFQTKNFLLFVFLLKKGKFLFASGNAPSCGCDDCTDAVLDSMAGSYTCRARMAWLQTSEGGSLTETNACTRVSQEFEGICGPMCDPDRCDGAPSTLYPTQSPKPPSPLYCFPEEGNRVEYDLWGLKVEVKERTSPCGPGSNVFSRDSVSVSTTEDELSLEFKKVGNVWEASEVRVLLPNHETEKFQYGDYRFHIKSVAVVDSVTNQITSTVMPKDLVIGMFTWDPTDIYDEVNPQNWMHEVDIEISRWNSDDKEDVQFLVQPYQYVPKYHRFFSGDARASTLEARLDPSDHWYSFKWLPGGVYWNSTAGGVQESEYTVESNVKAGRRCYVQCLPAEVEVRLNVWNVQGSQAPHGISESEAVKVVFDKFEYVESDVRYIEEGGYCSKHCQCAGECVNGKCAIGPSSNPSILPTQSPSKPPTTPSACGCEDCTDAVLDSMAGAYTCRARMTWLQSSEGGAFTEAAACTRVSQEFEGVCGPMCDPSRCDPSLSPTVSPTQSPSKPPTTPSACGCEDCTDAVLDSMAGAYTCRARMTWLQSSEGGAFTEAAACTRVSQEFEGVCGPMCDPNRCIGAALNV